MPAKRHRQRMKVLENCFTGTEAVEWLTKYLQNSEMFQSVSKEQVSVLDTTIPAEQSIKHITVTFNQC